jgi:hypothetical protein
MNDERHEQHSHGCQCWAKRAPALLMVLARARDVIFQRALNGSINRLERAIDEYDMIDPKAK